MSGEFWLGVGLTTVLFLLSTLVSIFGADLRRYFYEWRKNRNKQGVALRLGKLERELKDLEHLSSDPAVASALFWSGLYLVIAVSMLLALIGYLSLQIQEGFWRTFGVALAGIAWLMAYTVVIALHRKAQLLRNPVDHKRDLKVKIQEAKAALGEK